MKLRVDVERSGGFAGVTLRSSLSEEALSPAEIERILDLVRRFEAPPKGQPGAPDRFQYDVIVTESGRRRHATVIETVLGPEERSLLAALLARGTTTTS